MKLKPFPNDILVKSYDKTNLNSDMIHIVEFDKRRNDINLFEVLRTGDAVTMVKEGDIIGLKIGKHTSGVFVDDEKVAFTAEKDVEFVLEV